jgi:hypothetical protein
MIRLCHLLRLLGVGVLCLALAIGLVSRADAELVVGVDELDSHVYSIDPNTGTTTFLFDSGIPDTVYGASTSNSVGVIYATTLNDLYSVNVLAGTTSSAVGFSGATSSIFEIGFDRASGVLYGTDYSSLYTVNPGTGLTTVIGGLGPPSMLWAMTYVPGSGLYGVNEGDHTFYSISTATGLATSIGPTGADRIIDIAYEPATGRLIGSANVPGRIYVLDLGTGAATLLNSVDVPSMLGIAEVNPVPEPSTLAIWSLLATLGITVGWWRRRAA